MEPGILLCPCDEHQPVGIRGAPLHEGVQVIGHEAVRNECELLFSRGALNLRTRQCDCVGVGEETCAFVRAERQEITMPTAIVERREMFRAMRPHAPIGACDGPPEGGRHVVRLKPDTTSASVRLKPDTTS